MRKRLARLLSLEAIEYAPPPRAALADVWNRAFRERVRAEGFVLDSPDRGPLTAEEWSRVAVVSQGQLRERTGDT